VARQQQHPAVRLAVLLEAEVVVVALALARSRGSCKVTALKSISAMEDATVFFSRTGLTIALLVVVVVMMAIEIVLV
jgi:hypothetical protein